MVVGSCEQTIETTGTEPNIPDCAEAWVNLQNIGQEATMIGSGGCDQGRKHQHVSEQETVVLVVALPRSRRVFYSVDVVARLENRSKPNNSSFSFEEHSEKNNSTNPIRRLHVP